VHLRCAAGGTEEEIWLSFQPFRAFIKSNGSIEAVDAEARRQYSYAAETRTATIRHIDEIPERFERISKFYDFTIPASGIEKERGFQLRKKEHVLGGRRFVVFSLKSKTAAAKVTVDPHWKRVVAIESSASLDKPSGPTVIKLAYPREGPPQILSRYMLHVSAWPLVRTGLAELFAAGGGPGNS